MAFLLPYAAYVGVAGVAGIGAYMIGKNYISNSDPRLDKINEKLKKFEERNEGLSNDVKRSAELIEEYKEEIKKLLMEKEEMKKDIEKNGWNCKDYPIKQWQDIKVFSVAVTGNSGTGKSTFVNSFLNLTGSNKAKVGVTECTDVLDRDTFEPPRYTEYASGWPYSSKVMDVFDLPGCGTDKFPNATYIKNFGLRYFHIVIIMVAGRITEAETMLKTELDKFNIPCYFVRNKIDQDVQNNLEDGISEQETLKEIRADFTKRKITPFLISAKNKGYEWDDLNYEFTRSVKKMRGNAEYVEKDLDNTCDICWAAWIDTHFEDCGHRSICSKCAKKLNQITDCYRCLKEIKYKSSKSFFKVITNWFKSPKRNINIIYDNIDTMYN